MRCSNCNSVLEENWKFCATCGANIKESSEALTREIAQSIISSLAGSGNEGGLEIKIIPREMPIARERRAHSKREEQNSFLNTPNKPLEVIEPKTDITRLPGRIMLDAEIPGVESGNSIKIMLLGESIEIRAVAPEKMYLKIMRIPRSMMLVNSAFSGGKLKVELGEAVRYRV